MSSGEIISVILIIAFMAWLNEYYPFINFAVIFVSFCVAIFLVIKANLKDR